VIAGKIKEKGSRGKKKGDQTKSSTWGKGVKRGRRANPVFRKRGVDKVKQACKGTNMKVGRRLPN